MKNGSFHGMTHGTQGAAEGFRILYGVVGIWFLAASIGGLKGIFDQPGVPPVTMGIFLLLPIAGLSLAYAAVPQVRQAADALPLWLVTSAHTWRFVGIGFVLGAVTGVLPPQFGYPEGIGDVVAASLCLPLAGALRRPGGSPRLRAAFVAWNVFGLIDLLSAITLGILYSPSSFGILRTDVSTELMTRFPMSLIPTFFVPLFILLHALSLRRSRELG